MLVRVWAAKFLQVGKRHRADEMKWGGPEGEAIILRGGSRDFIHYEGISRGGAATGRVNDRRAGGWWLKRNLNIE